MQAPLIPLSLAFILGILIGNSVKIPNLYLLIALTAAISLMLLHPLLKKKALPVCALLAAFTILGTLGINEHLYTVPEATHISRIEHAGLIGLEGTVCENPDRTPEKTDLTIEVSRVVQNGLGVPVKGRVLLAVNETADIPKYGDFIRAKVKLKRPHNFQNPGGFDYEKYLRLKAILVRGYIDNPANIAVIRQNTGNPVKSSIHAFRNKLRAMIRENAPAEQASILIAMVIGEQNEIPKDILIKFNRTGTTHILAISGFNVGLVFLFSILVLQTILKSSEHLLLRYNVIMISTCMAAFPVILYACIAGLGMSVIRATIMVLTLVIAVVFEKERDLPNILALAALIMLAFHPPAFFDVSFQLSFAAVAAIMFIAPRCSGLLRRDRPLDRIHKPGFIQSTLRIFWMFLIVTIAATLGALPLTTYYFNTLSLMVVVGNILLIPIMGYAVIVLSMAFIVMAPMSAALSALLLKFSAFLIKISLSIVDYLSSLPYASIYTTTPTIFEITAYYILLISTVYLIDVYFNRKDQERLSGIRFKLTVTVVTLMLLFLFMDGLYYRLKDSRRKNLSVTFIDVGQGNSALVRLPGGKNMLIDGGGFYDDRFDIGKNVIAPYLWREKIKVIDTIVLTHPHPDHLNGLLFIVRNFSVGEVWTNDMEISDEPYLNFKKVIKDNDITHRIIDNKSIFPTGQVGIRILSPGKGRTKDKRPPDSSLNDQSLVMRLTFKKISFLFPGDISTVMENKILRRHRHLSSQILLSPHHGSRSSNDHRFIRKVHPHIVVFSCGRDNMFRLPATEVLERYRAFGSEIYRTDRDGAITIETDGEKIVSKSTFNGPTPSSAGPVITKASRVRAQDH